ncbi:hypothetical protein P3T40_007649 [Paraburkholderia sp. EB58]|jgi:hypothetical protein
MRCTRKYWRVFWAECHEMFLDYVQPLIALAHWLRGKR